MTDSGMRSVSAGYRALLRVRLSLAQRIGLFLLLSALVAGLTFWLQPRVAAVGIWGYPLGFAINGLSAATVVVPSAGFAAVLVMARDLHPLLLGIAAGAGGVLGELTGYWLGTYCRVALADTRLERFLGRYMSRFGGEESSSGPGCCHSSPWTPLDSRPAQRPTRFDGFCCT